MRLFIAVELPKPIQNQIYETGKYLRESVIGVRWIAPQNLHLTLKFLGEVPEQKLTSIDDILRETFQVHSYQAFSINFSQLGAFPSLSHPRVIWLGISDGQDVLRKLASMLEDPFEKIGFKRETRDYSPHLTLGKVNDEKKVKNLKEIAVSYKTSFAGISVGMVSSMQSILSPEGAIYKRVANYKLLK